ncbi:hypothetical protein RhiirA5_477730 [Rhizophagus irregularis]|uniref:Uncharacterized protein n=1 Tax=Rhizophagus irregularis TaxID=588596 RepID=A0A2I1E0P7_9GLOM|nr:hypothetical protein RhiirA5_477730 [Rhizophagus irregularis]PKY15698.1 hypothetical protein RhiirB3_477587 [Rhizophagus irregularis]
MTKVLWGIDKQKAEEINIDQLFGPDILDEQNKGIPIGYLLFSAAGGTHKASSSYNHIILKELLLYYKHRLEQEKWYKFTQKVAMTDCDHKERKALIEVWPDIHLILCLFHVSQSWEDKLKAVLGHHGGHEIMAFRKHLERRYTNF